MVKKKRRYLNLNWIVGNLQNALDTWNGKLSEIYAIITQSPAEFKGGTIWNIILNINGGLQAIGLALLVLFFVVGIVRTCTNFSELKRPEQAVRLFLRFVIAKGIVTYGLDLMLAIFRIIQGIVGTIMSKSSFQASGMTLPQTIIDAINNCGFFESIPLWAVTLIGSLLVTILSFILILTCYGRFFKLYMYTAIAPIPLSSFAGETTQNIGKSFLKSYIAVCLEGAIIVLACVIFSVFATSSPPIDTSVATITMIWKYMGETIFNMLVLVGTIRLSDRIVREMMGL
ncbi:MAG: hypothetical protein IJ223_07440 [Clostridia bacterium]|nr:hypothetical protein [Clostridia bacterium]